MIKLHTETGFVVSIWIGEVKVSMKFSVIELDRDGMMRLLIHCPDEANKIQA